MKLATWLLAGVTLMSATGCASWNGVSHAANRRGTFYGDFGITGNGNTYIVERGSKLDKLSIAGDNNSVHLEEGVTCRHIEFWGNGNTVSIPEYLILRTTSVGKNQIIRRPMVTQGVHYQPMEASPAGAGARPAEPTAAPKQPATSPRWQPPVDQPASEEPTEEPASPSDDEIGDK